MSLNKKQEISDIIRVYVTSFPYRFIVSELQTCFILHCSFAEVNSWEREGERGHRREVGDRGRTGSNGSDSLKWPFVHSFNPLNCVFKLAFTSQKGHRLRLVSERPIQCVFAWVLMSSPPITIIPPSLVNWPLCDGFIMPLDCSRVASFTRAKDTLTSLSTRRIIPAASINTFSIPQCRQLMKDLQGCSYSPKPFLALWKFICTRLSCKQWKARPCFTTKMFGQMCTTGACTQTLLDSFISMYEYDWASQHGLRLEHTEDAIM